MQFLFHCQCVQLKQFSDAKTDFTHNGVLYIYSLMMFVARNKELFVTNANVHNFPTRSQNDLHLPIANLSVFQTGVYFSGVKIFNSLPLELKQIFHDTGKFKNAFKRFLLDNSFYSEEYHNWGK